MSFKGEGPFWRWLLQCDNIDDVLFHVTGRAAVFSNVLPSDPPARQIHNTRRILLRIKWLLDTQRLAYNLSGRNQLRLKMVMLLRIILHILDFGSSEHPSGKVDSEYTIYRRVTLETLLSALRLLMLFKTPMTLDEEDLVQSRLNHMLVIWKNVQPLSIVEDSLLAQLVPELLASRNRMSTIVKEDISEAARERSNSSLTSFLMTSLYLPKVINGTVIADTKSNLSLVENSTCFWRAYDVVSDTVTSIMVDSEDPRNEITPEASSLLQMLSEFIESPEASPRHLFLFEALFVGIGAVRSLRTPEALQNHPLLDRVKRITRYEVLEFREIFERPDYQPSKRSSDTNWSPKTHKPTPTQSTMASTPDIESSATSHTGELQNGDLQNGSITEIEESVPEMEPEPQLDEKKAPEPMLLYPTPDVINPGPEMPMSPPLSDKDLSAEPLSTEQFLIAPESPQLAASPGESPSEEIQQDALMVPGQEYQSLRSLTPSSFGDPLNPRLSTVSTTFEEAMPLVMEAQRAVVVRMVGGSQCQSPTSQHGAAPMLTRIGSPRNDESTSSVASVSEYSQSTQSPSFNPVATYSKFLQNFPEPESRKVVARSKSVVFSDQIKGGRPRTISISNPISRPREDSGSIFGSDSDKASITRHQSTRDRTRNETPTGYDRDLTGDHLLSYSPPPPFSERSSERSSEAVRASHDEKSAWEGDKPFGNPLTTSNGFKSPNPSVSTMPSRASGDGILDHVQESDVSITALLARLRTKERDHSIPIESGLEVVTDQMAPPMTPKHGRLYSDEQLQNRIVLARPITSAADSDTWSVRKSIAGESTIDKRKRGLFGRLRTSGKDSISKSSTRLPQGLEYCFSSCGKRAILWSRKDSAQIVVLPYPFTQGQVFRLGQLAPWISDEAYVLGLNIRFLSASSDRIAAVVHLDQVRRLYLLMPDGEQQYISLDDEIPLIQTLAISPDGTFVALGCGVVVLVFRILNGNFEKAKEINLKPKLAAQSVRYQRVGFSVDSKKLVCASQVSQSVQKHAVITGIWECSGSEIREYGWIEPVPIPVGYGDDSGITSCFYVPKGADRVPGQVFLSAAVSKAYPSILFLNKKHKFRPLEITDRKIECASQCTVGGFDSAHAIAVRSGRHKIFLIDARNGRAAPVLDLSQQRKNIGLKTEVMALGVPDETCVLVMWRDGNEALKLTKVLVDGRSAPETIDVGDIYRSVAGA